MCVFIYLHIYLVYTRIYKYICFAYAYVYFLMYIHVYIISIDDVRSRYNHIFRVAKYTSYILKQSHCFMTLQRANIIPMILLNRHVDVCGHIHAWCMIGIIY